MDISSALFQEVLMQWRHRRLTYTWRGGCKTHPYLPIFYRVRVSQGLFQD